MSDEISYISLTTESRRDESSSHFQVACQLSSLTNHDITVIVSSSSLEGFFSLRDQVSPHLGKMKTDERAGPSDSRRCLCDPVNDETIEDNPQSSNEPVSQNPVVRCEKTPAYI